MGNFLPRKTKIKGFHFSVSYFIRIIAFNLRHNEKKNQSLREAALSMKKVLMSTTGWTTPFFKTMKVEDNYNPNSVWLHLGEGYSIKFKNIHQEKENKEAHQDIPKLICICRREAHWTQRWHIVTARNSNLGAQGKIEFKNQPTCQFLRHYGMSIYHIGSKRATSKCLILKSTSLTVTQAKEPVITKMEEEVIFTYNDLSGGSLLKTLAGNEKFNLRRWRT